MGLLFPLIVLIVSLSITSNVKADGSIISARLLDLIIRDYTYQTYGNYFKTGKFHRINLPSNFSGIEVDTIRFRCGSLRRYGAKVKEFYIKVGVTLQPCVERVLIVRSNLGERWSNIYYGNYEVIGYKLITPILGLLAYNAGDDRNFSTPFELGIQSGLNPITINFNKFTQILNTTNGGIIPLCACFGKDGNVTLTSQVSRGICRTFGHGHFGLVVETPLIPSRRVVSRWRVATGAGIGAAIGGVLLIFLVIALFVKGKNKSRSEEVERRAYEEEALQVSMVGHVRAPTASGTRTVPIIEHDFRPPR